MAQAKDEITENGIRMKIKMASTITTLADRKRFFGISFLIVLLGAVIFVLNASRVGPIEACLDGCSPPISQIDGELQVLNLNMLHGHPEFEFLPERIELLVAQIKSLSPDIITLQEAPWTRRTGSTVKYLADEIGMNYVYLPANGNRWTIFFSEGEAIMSKFPLKGIVFKELLPRAGFFEHRVALKVSAVTPLGEIQVATTHLTNGDPKINQGQARDLYDFVSTFENGSVVITGDFNAQEDSPQIRLLSDNWIDTYRWSNPESKGLTCCAEPLSGANIDSRLEKRIDYIFLRPGKKLAVEVVNSEVIFDHPYESGNEHIWISDHIGILTTIRISPRLADQEDRIP